MIIDKSNKYILFSHLPKTGGTYISWVLRHIWKKNKLNDSSLCLAGHTKPTYSNERIIFKDHPGLMREDSIKREERTICADRNNVYVMGCIRNPCDYYLSVWAFGCKNTRNTGGIKYNIAHTHKHLLPLYNNSYNIDNFQKWLIEILDINMVSLWDIRTPSWDRINKNVIQKYDLGLLSYRVCALYFNGNYEHFLNIDNKFGQTDYIITNYGRDTNSIQLQLFILLNNLGVFCTINDFKSCEYYKNNIDKLNITFYNKTQRYSYKQYYTKELLELVENKDRIIFKKY